MNRVPLGLLPLRSPRLLGGQVDRARARRLLRGMERETGSPFAEPRVPGRTSLMHASRLVFTVRTPTGAVLVKHPRNAQAARALVREWEVLEALAADGRLDPWRPLLPRAEGPRPSAPVPFLTQSRLRGVPADLTARSRDRPQDVLRTTAAALDLLAELRKATGVRVPATGAVDRWVEPRLALLGSEVAWCRSPAGRAGLRALRRYLHESLTGALLTQGWTHGDFHPGNVLMSEDHARVAGVFDWSFADVDGPAEVDACTFVMAVRSAMGRCSLGVLAAEALRAGGLPSAERELLAGSGVYAAESAGAAGLPLLTWLWHVAGNVWETPQYGGNRWWVLRVVAPVLREASRWASRQS